MGNKKGRAIADSSQASNSRRVFKVPEGAVRALARNQYLVDLTCLTFIAADEACPLCS
jgi:hypothetical protein